MENQQRALTLAGSTPLVKQREGKSTSIANYEAHLKASIDWLLRTIKHGKGGSCAYYAPWGYWSKPYPETTGYIIPTLLNYSRYTQEPQAKEVALGAGEWLLDIQDPDGYWNGGLHPASESSPSVFNTGQILLGLNALYRETEEQRWQEAAHRGASWLAKNLDADGQWHFGNYHSGFNPSYYTRVAWPMLDTWSISKDASVREAAERVLLSVIARKKKNGVFIGWGFEPEKPAFTHTIAYTLRGFLESAALLDDWKTYGEPAVQALDKMYRQAELNRGRLAGAYYEDWKKEDWYTCLTGNVQIALCLLMYEEKAPDLRLVNAACKLVDRVCEAQSLKNPMPGVRGAIAGSAPIWGNYIRARYPNWAAKFHADALLKLISRLKKEGL